MSMARAPWVSEPTEITSTPSARGVGMRSRVTPPDTSMSGRGTTPATRARASATPSSSKLSSITTSAPAARASSSSARDCTSHSTRMRVRGVRAGALDGRAHAAADGDVVVLDEHAGAEVVAVVVPPPMRTA
jgi:hypothetical protein